MAASSQVSQNKRERYESLSSRLDLPDAKRPRSGTLGYDSDLMALLDKIDTMDNYNSTTPEDAYTAPMNEVEGKSRLNGIIKSLEDKIGSEAQTENNIESSDEGSSTEQLGSTKEGELTEDGNSEATSVRFDIGDFTYIYDDVSEEFGFFVDHFTPYELEILQNHIHGDSIPDIMYSDAVHSYDATTDIFYGSLWEDDLWQFNEHPVIQNDFASPQPEESGSSTAELHQ